jgi:signal transduction histidine kinase
MMSLPWGQSTRLDRGIAATIVVGCALQAVLSPARWAWVAVPAFGVVVSGLVLLRRTRPDLIIVAFLISNVCDLAALHWDTQWTGSASVLGAVVLMYSLGRYGLWPQWLWHAALIVVLSEVIELPIAADKATSASWTTREFVGDAIIQAFFVTSVVGAGWVVRHQAERRAHEAEQQRVHERQQLARDLHDVLAHCISAIALRADAAVAVAANNPDAAKQALEQIRDTARQSLTEVRLLIGILREEQTTSPNPQPDLRFLDTLATLEHPAVVIEQEADIDGVPLATSRALYRIAQEAVTNVRRHARDATTIRIKTEHDVNGLRLTVHDDGRTTGHTREGFGLRGMRERVELLDGSFAAGVDPYGGWTVTAIVPTSTESS